jgi:Domain of unknown function (DUF4224)
MSNTFLTPEELAELTESRLRSKQVDWLDRHGWVYVLSRLGNPRVLRAHAEIKMGLVSTMPSAETEPDFSHWE